MFGLLISKQTCSGCEYRGNEAECSICPAAQPECPSCGCIVDEPNHLCIPCEERAQDMKLGIYEDMWPAMRAEREVSYSDSIPF